VAESPVTSDRVWTIPNLLSFVRLALVPVFVVLVVLKVDAVAVVVLVVSGATDYLDGWIARRWGQVTRIGALLDPVADRLFILTTLLGLAYRHVIPWWLVAALLLRDLVIVGSLALLTPEERRPLEVNYIGKAATASLLYAFPFLLLGHFHGTVPDIGQQIGWGFALWGTGLYWWSAVIYVRNVFIVRAARPATVRQPV
jgi:cardiolipin synthase